MTSPEERLLRAIFEGDEVKETDTDETRKTEAEMPEMPENYPDTIVEKVDYAEYVQINSLQYIAKSINRLGRLHRLLAITERDGERKLPDIITNNELRMALEPLLRVRGGIVEITDMLLEVYHGTKKETHNDD